MKRISLCVALLACLPGLSEAWCGCGCGVRYSPYAFNYYSSGLVPCDAEYTPYAFSYYNSGLVEGYGICYDYGSVFAFPIPRSGPVFREPFCRRVSPAVRRHAQAPSFPASRRDGPGPQRRCEVLGKGSPMRPPALRGPDPLDLIRQHLRTKGFAAPCIDRILRVDNQLVSVNFLVKDRNLLIKYWNPQELERVNTKEGYKQKACATYKEDWESYAQRYKQTGGEIYTITASEPEAIVAALDACTKLSPGLGTPVQQTMYAKN